MADSDIIILSDIIQRDLYRHDSVDDAISELMDLAANINRSSLYFAWMVGRFANDNKLKTKYGIESQAQLAKLLCTSEMSISRYCSVSRLLTAEQLKKLSSLRISTSAVLEIARAYSDGYKEESKLLMDAVLSNEISTAGEIRGSFRAMLMEKNKPYNLLPGGEAPEGSEDLSSTLDEDLEEAEESTQTPADKLLKSDAKVIDVDEIEEDDDDGSSKDDGSLNKKDAVMMLKNVRQTIAAVRRDMVQIWRDLQAEVESVMESQGVILGDQESSDEFDELMSAAYQDMQEALKVLIEQMAKGAEYGYVTNQVKMPKAGKDAFCGCGLFVEE